MHDTEEGPTDVTRVYRVGLLGCGVVGSGVVAALHQNRDWLAARCGVRFEIQHIVVRDIHRSRGALVQRDLLTTDWRSVCEDPDIDIVMEAMGGVHPALEAIQTALGHGKHVVTANKEVLATRGEALLQLAAAQGRSLLFEASVLAGIPVLHALQTYFVANRVTSVRGIVNGTSNYILTQMARDGQSFLSALAAAQEAGYAEADPTYDVDGFDAAFKLQILTRCALHAQLDVDQIQRVGIGHVTDVDMQLAQVLRCKLKHVAQAAWSNGVVEAAVGPVVLTPDDPLYSIDGVQNALSVHADLVGQVLFAGPGAGGLPTASAMVEDLVQLVASTPLPTPSAAPRVTTRTPNLDAWLIRRSGTRLRGDGPSDAHLQALLGADEIRSLHIPGDTRTHGWAVRGTHLSAQQCVDVVEQLFGGDIACYPFADWPADTPVEISVMSPAVPLGSM